MNKVSKLYFVISIFLVSACFLRGNERVAHYINTPPTVASIGYNLKGSIEGSTNLSKQLIKDRTMDLVNRRIQLNDHVSLEMTRDYDNGQYMWTATLLDEKTDKQIVIYSDTIDEAEIGESGDELIDMYLLSGALLDDNDLYVIYDKFGAIILYKYHFTSPDTYTNDSVQISARSVSASEGQYTSDSYLVKVNNDVFMFVYADQIHSTESFVAMLRLYPDLTIKEIIPSDTFRAITALGVGETDIAWLKEREQMVKTFNIELTDEDKKREAYIKTNIGKGLTFIEVDMNDTMQEEQIDKLRDDGFSIYEFLNGYFFFNSDYKPAVESYIKGVLNFCGQDSEIKLYDAIPVPRAIYFFYQNKNMEPKIIRYAYYGKYSLWHVLDFNEADLNH